MKKPVKILSAFLALSLASSVLFAAGACSIRRTLKEVRASRLSAEEIARRMSSLKRPIGTSFWSCILTRPQRLR